MTGAPTVGDPWLARFCSQKWLTRIWLRDIVHDGPKMTGSSYRVPRYPVAPGASVPEEDLEIIHAMPVKSLITRPATGGAYPGRELEVAGHAWAGDSEVAKVDVSIDFGATWAANAALATPQSARLAAIWGAYRVSTAWLFRGLARATDTSGASQPFRAAWNPKGYLNNAMHHVSVAGGVVRSGNGASVPRLDRLCRRGMWAPWAFGGG